MVLKKELQELSVCGPHFYALVQLLTSFKMMNFEF